MKEEIMFRWIGVLAAVALAVGVAYGQSSPQTQPTLPLGQGQSMGGHMNAPMMSGNAEMEHGMMSMMQMMHMLESGMTGPDLMDQEIGGPMCHGQMAMMRAAGMAGSPASHLEARLAFTKAELAIIAAQEAAWQAYATALRGQALPMSTDMAAQRHAMAGNAAFPDRFAARITMLEGRLASLRAVRDAAVALYGKLDDGQKTKADALLPMSLCL
jgi:hypothetical protein